MKYTITAISTFLLAASIAVSNAEELLQLSKEELLGNTNFLLSLYLLLLGLFLVLSALQKDTSESVVGEERNDRESGASRDAAKSKEANQSLPVLHFLSLLQGKGRLLDFVMDDIAPYSDEQVGRVARVVHQGVREVLDETMKIEPLHSGSEGDVVAVEADFSTLQYRFVGDLSKQPPFSGKVLHRGWKARGIALPYAIDDATLAKNPESREIVQPMEVELA